MRAHRAYKPRPVQPLPPLTPEGYAFSATRLNFPTGLNGSATGTNRFQLSNLRFGVPHWGGTGWRFAFANLYLAGVSAPERATNSIRTIEFATVTDDAIGTNAWPVTFNGGQTSATIQPGEIILSDEVAGFAPAADSMPFIRTQTSVPVSGNHLVGHYLQTQGSDLGEGNEGTSTSQVAKRLTGAITAANPGSTQSYGPCFAVAKGWDGAPVFMINGTSRQVPTSDHVYKLAARGVVGATQRGLDSTVGGRMSFGDFSQSGAYALHSASEDAGSFSARMAILRAVGNAPFNRIITDIGPNDINGATPMTLAEVQAATTNWWTFWRAHCPTVPVYHLFGEPWTTPTAADNNYWTTVADQQPLTPVQGQWFDWLLNGPGRPAWVTPIDMRPAYEAPGAPGRWKVPGRAGSLLASVATSALTCSIDMAAVEELGVTLVVEAERIEVSATSGPAANQTILTHSRFTAAHAAGVSVRTAYVRDGVHPGPPLMIAGGQRLAQMKVDGTLH